MKRFLASALIVGISTFGLVGCEEKTEVEERRGDQDPEPAPTRHHHDGRKKTGDAKDGGTSTPPVEPPNKSVNNARSSGSIARNASGNPGGVFILSS